MICYMAWKQRLLFSRQGVKTIDTDHLARQSPLTLVPSHVTAHRFLLHALLVVVSSCYVAMAALRTLGPRVDPRPATRYRVAAPFHGHLRPHTRGYEEGKSEGKKSGYKENKNKKEKEKRKWNF
jgi:hypothetical protein